VLELTSALLCADVLTNPGGRLSIYNLLLDVSADRFPTVLPYLVAVGIWMHEAPQMRLCTTRVVLLSPGQDAPVAEGTDRFSLGGEVVRHVSVHRFRGVILPEPGTYRVQFVLGGDVVRDIPLVVVESGSQVSVISQPAA
jgi:hypothetical protein